MKKLPHRADRLTPYELEDIQQRRKCRSLSACLSAGAEYLIENAAFSEIVQEWT
jgi:hypothetical protein